MCRSILTKALSSVVFLAFLNTKTVTSWLRHDLICLLYVAMDKYQPRRYLRFFLNASITLSYYPAGAAPGFPKRGLQFECECAVARARGIWGHAPLRKFDF